MICKRWDTPENADNLLSKAKTHVLYKRKYNLSIKEANQALAIDRSLKKKCEFYIRIAKDKKQERKRKIRLGVIYISAFVLFFSFSMYFALEYVSKKTANDEYLSLMQVIDNQKNLTNKLFLINDYLEHVDNDQYHIGYIENIKKLRDEIKRLSELFRGR